MSRQNKKILRLHNPATRPQLANEPTLAKLSDMTDSELWTRVDELNGSYEQSWSSLKTGLRTCTKLALEMGQIFHLLKGRTKHGEWVTLVKANCKTMQLREVQRLMQLHEYREQLDQMDPAWAEKYTISDALVAIQDYKTRKVVEACSQKRPAAKRSDRAEPSISSPLSCETNSTITSTESAAHAAKRPTKRKVSLADVSRDFRMADKSLNSIRKRVPTLSKSAELDKVEERARSVRAECDELLKVCELRRKALEEDGLPKAEKKASTDDKAKNARPKRSTNSPTTAIEAEAEPSALAKKSAGRRKRPESDPDSVKYLERLAAEE